jgi:predicted NodU family carbamoyl transferase
MSPLLDTISSTSKSRWSKASKHAWLIKSKLLRWLFCVNDELLAAMQEEAALRDEVRDAMTMRSIGTGTRAITTAMKEVYNETGYDMSNYTETIEEMAEESADLSELVTSLVPLGLLDNRHLETPLVVRVAPKFAAALVLTLRAKFGNLSPTEANRLLIEREYLRVCREGCVRNVDIVTHQQCVMNAFFTEGVLDQLCTTRTRCPQWMREAFGIVPRAPPTIC